MSNSDSAAKVIPDDETAFQDGAEVIWVINKRYIGNYKGRL